MHNAISQRKSRRRLNARGYVLAEFGASFAVLIMIMIVLASGAVVPLRFLIACGMVESMVHRAALAERRSLSGTNISADPSLKMANTCGIEFGAPQITIVCVSQSAGTFTVAGDTPVPAEWLPNGTNAPCTYSLQLIQPAIIRPLCTNSGGLTGLNAPLLVTFSLNSCWENQGCDPATMEFFINE